MSTYIPETQKMEKMGLESRTTLKYEHTYTSCNEIIPIRAICFITLYVLTHTMSTKLVLNIALIVLTMHTN